MLLQAAALVGAAVGVQFSRWFRRHKHGSRNNMDDNATPAEQVRDMPCYSLSSATVPFRDLQKAKPRQPPLKF